MSSPRRVTALTRNAAALRELDCDRGAGGGVFPVPSDVDFSLTSTVSFRRPPDGCCEGAIATFFSSFVSPASDGGGGARGVGGADAGSMLISTVDAVRCTGEATGDAAGAGDSGAGTSAILSRDARGADADATAP